MGTTVDKLQKLLQSKQSLVSIVNEKVGTSYTIDTKLSDVINSVNDINSGGITPTGTIKITSNGIVDVTNYASANVNVPIPEGYIKPSGRLNISQNGVVDVTSYKEVNVSVSSGSSTQDMLQARVNLTKTCEYLLYQYKGTTLDFIANLDTSEATSFKHTFASCSNITSIPYIETSKGNNMQSMFYSCTNLLTLPQINTGNSTTLHEFLYGCRNLLSLPQLDTRKVTDLYGAFMDCQKIQIIDITYYNIGDTMNSNNIYRGTYSLKAAVIREFGTGYVISNYAFHLSYHILGKKHATYNPTGAKDGYIYVPRNMIATLSSATNWSTYATQLRALEDYTVDGTTTGALDLVKMGVEV